MLRTKTILEQKRRRGRNKVNTKLIFYHTNINGFKSKCGSLKIVVSENRPDVISVNEVKAVSSPFLKQYFRELGYEVIVKKEGGLLIAAKSHLKLKNVTSSSHPRILVGRISTKEMILNIIGAYGLQETDGIEERRDFFNELSIEIEACVNP